MIQHIEELSSLTIKDLVLLRHLYLRENFQHFFCFKFALKVNAQRLHYKLWAGPKK